MDFELFNLSKMVDSYCETGKPIDHDVAETQEIFKNECTRILVALHTNSANNKPSFARTYVIQHQIGLINILRKIDLLRILDSPSCRNINQLETCENQLTQLVNEIKNSFPGYFDYNVEVTSNIMKSARINLHDGLAKLTDYLKTSGIEAGFEILLNEIFGTTIQFNNNITFAQIDYLDKTLHRFIEIISRKNVVDPFTPVAMLISLQCNHPAFYTFCCSYLREQMELKENISEQVHCLNFLLKKIRQIEPVHSLIYEPDLSGIKEAVIGFINTELDYIRSLDFLSEELSSGGLIEKNYRVSFTVRQLAIFIHLQVKTGIIITDKPRTIHQYASRHFTTPDTVSISEKSFKNAYYGSSISDIEKVVAKISHMLVLAQEKL
ncbi:hypothetical protein SRABI27_03755 [Pedobacter sp. Bi27]|uniref:hypothetical protein n=1 Tax=Pedobacter sp. Bi27 TaxID=2822351 RepID=UPI001DB455FD|nr:hypothetical protein [Pedobacter sp. Bi27]CAH0280301.1 hypothetical protein SRABI27_03755 [Pedobacter sp. Bi27]